MEGIIMLLQHLFIEPEQLNSAGEFAADFTLLFVVLLIMAWLAANLAKMMLEKERLGTATRLRLAIGWTAIAFGLALLMDAFVLFVMHRIPHWTAIAPHCTVALVAGIWAIVQHSAIKQELKEMRQHVDNAKRQAA
jgi:protein-S-isoprenylcysteine O-methyltransferase Ste14